MKKSLLLEELAERNLVNLRAYAYYFCFFAALFIAFYSFFFLEINTVFQLIGSAGGFISATSIFFLFIISLPSFQKNASSILGSFSWLRRAEMASIAYDIQGNINQFRDAVNKEAADLIPEAKVEWVTETNRESFFDYYKGKIIIRMNPCEDNDVNLAKASFLQVSKGVIPESRLYVETKLNLAIDLALVKKMLSNQGKRGAYRYFVNEMAVPELTDEDVLHLLERIEIIDGKGFFTRLFLRQLKELPVVSGLSFQNLSEVRNDVNKFLDYSELVAKRREHEHIPLNYEGPRIKSAIIYVALRRKMAFEGIKPYLKRALLNRRNKCEVIFFISFSHAIEFTRRIIGTLTNSYGMELIPDSDKEYQVGDQRYICATLLVNPSSVLNPKNDLLLHELLIKAVKSSLDDTGWACLPLVEGKIKEKSPNFNVAEYGYDNLSQLLKTIDFIEFQPKEGSTEDKVRVKQTLIDANEQHHQNSANT